MARELTLDDLKAFQYEAPKYVEPSATSDKKLEGSAADPWYSFAAGAGRMVKGVGTFLGGSDSTVAELGANAEEYWTERKSAKLKAKEAELARKMQDKDVGILETMGSVVADPYLAANMLAGSAPATAVGMGAGGLVAKGMASAGLMVGESGALTSLGARTAGGIGEGLMLVPDVYQSTQGSGAASAAGLALAVVTNLATPGNLAGAAAAKMSGRVADDTVANAFNRGVLQRFGTAVAGEGAQEFTQEGGQAAIEQLGRGEALDFQAIAKQGGVGAVLGGVMGGGLHPVVGEGAPKFATAAERDAALGATPAPAVGSAPEVDPSLPGFSDRRLAARNTLREQEMAEQLNGRIEIVQGLVDANPNDPVARAELETLQAAQQLNNVRATGDAETVAVAEQTQAVAAATLAAARDPANKEAFDTAETMRAALALRVAGPKGVEQAANIAAQAGVAAITAAPDADNAVAAFTAANQASSTLRTTVTGIQNVAAGVAKAGREIEASGTEQFAEPEVVTPEQAAKIAHQTRIQQEKEKLAALKVEREAAKLDSERAKVAAVAKERTALELPTINADLVPEATGKTSFDTAPTGSYTIAESPDGQTVDVVDAKGEIFDTYRGPQAVQDASLTRDRLNARPASAPAPQNRDAAIGGTDPREAYIQHVIQESEQAAATPARRGTLGAARDAYIAEYDEQRADAMYGRSDEELQMIANNGGSSDVTREFASAILARRGVTGSVAVSNQGQTLSEMLNAAAAATEAAAPMSAAERAFRDTFSDAARRDATITAMRGLQPDTLRKITLNRNSVLAPEMAAFARELAGDSAAPTTSRLGPVREAAIAMRDAGYSPPQRQVQTAVQHEAQRNNIRQVEENFTTRGRAALNNGVLDKLGEFWTSVMGGRGQRVLDFNVADLANVADSIRNLPQDKLNELKDRYNAELNRKAREWAMENNQGVLTTLTDPIASIRKHGSSVEIDVYGLGRHGANPYKVATRSTGNMTVNSDGHFTSVSLDDAPGSAELGYRLGAEIDRMAGMTAGADRILSTNNRMRRQMQSVFHDTLPGFGPGHVSPLTTGGSESPQGVPASLWNAATPIQRVGLNILRAAHSVTENRTGGGRTAAAFLENLQYNAQKQIVAVTEPIDPRGFPVGTVVTDAELDRKLAETDPTVMASARGRTASGGVGIDTAKLAILTNTLLAKIENDPNATIPAAMVNRAKQIGRQIGGWMFSEAETSGATGVTQETAEARVRDMVGDNAAKLLLDSGLVSFVQSGEDLTGDTFSDANGKVQGATLPDGKIVLVLGNLSEGTIDGVLAHEALHSTIKTLLGEDTYNALMSRLDTMLKAGEGAQWLKDAEARVPPNTDPAQRLEEIAAYAVELEVRGGTRGNPLVRWARDFMSALRAAIIQNKVLPEALRTWAIKNIQPADLTRLAVAGLKRAAVGEGAGVRQSQRRDFGAEIDALMEEHRAPGTSNERRAEINDELRTAHQFQRAEQDVGFEQASARNPRYSVAEEDAVLHTPVADPLPQELNILNFDRRGAWERLNERVRTVLQDKHVALRRIQQIAKIESENIRMDTMGALDRLGSKLMAEQRRLVDAPMAKMEGIMTAAGFTPEEGRASLDKLLVAMHVKEYNAHIAELNPLQFDNDENPGSGIKNSVAAETIRLLTGSGDAKAKALLAAREEYRQMIADLQSFAVDRGLETQTTIDNWNKKFPNYAPFNRELDVDENLSIGTVPGSQGFSLRSGIARRAMGSSKEIISPLASTMLWGVKTTTRGENAIVSRTMFEFAKAFVPNYMTAGGELKPMWRVDVVPSSRTVKLMNVYQVPTANGGMSPEFYNRGQAQAFADKQQGEWEKLNPDADPDTSGIIVQRPYGDEPQSRVIVATDPNHMNSPNVMIVPIEGVNHMIEFDKQSPDAMVIVEAFKGKASAGSSAQTTNKMLTPFRMFSRWVMATSTGFNPVFAFFNAARDIQAAAINAGADKIPGWSAGDSTKIATGFVGAFRGINKQLREEFKQLHTNGYTAPLPTPGSTADWMERMVAAGGATGIAHSVTDIDSAETQMRRLFGQEALDKMTGKDVPTDWLSRSDRALVKIGDTFHRLGEGETRARGGAFVSKRVLARIGRWNESAELTTRTLVFKRATELYQQAGHDLETAEKMAANISKNISTNFNRRGNFTNVINQLVPFFNAAMQGTARLAETLFVKETYEVTKGDKLMLDQRTKLTPYGKAVLGTLASLGALQSMLLLAAGYDDDEVPKHVKDRAFIIPDLDGGYVAIPMPHGFNLLVNAGRELSDALVQGAQGNGRKALAHIADGTWGQIGALNPLGNAGNTVTDLLPALLDPFVSIAMNQDAFGRPIAKEDLNPMAPTPGFKRAKEGATGFSKAVAEGLNAITLGNQDKPGMLSPTPDQIDFLMGYIGGGVGREVAKSMQTGVAMGQDLLSIEREQLPTNRVPLLGRIYGDTTEPMVTNQKVFNITKELNILQAQYKGMMERGEKEEARAFRAEHPELALQDDFAKFSRGGSKQKKERVKLREEGEVGKINTMAEKKETKAQELLRRYEELLPD